MSTVHLSLLVLFILCTIKAFVSSQLLNQSDRKANLIKFRAISSQFGLTKPFPFQFKPWLQDSWPYSNNWQPYPLSLLPPVPAPLDPSALIAQHRLELSGPYETYLENNPSPNLLSHNYNQQNDLTHQSFLESLKRAKKVAKSLEKYSKGLNQLQSENKVQRRGCKNKADCSKHSQVSDHTKFSDSTTFSHEDDEPLNEEQFGFKFANLPFDSNHFGKANRGMHHFEASFERERRKDKPYDYFNSRSTSKSNGYKRSYSKPPSWDEEDYEKPTDHSTHRDDYMSRYQEPVFDDEQEESTEEPESHFQYSQGDLGQGYHRSHHRDDSTKRSHSEPEYYSRNFYNNFKFKNGVKFTEPIKRSKFIDRTRHLSEPHSIKCVHKKYYHDDHNNEYDDHYSQYDETGQGEESRKSKLTLNKDQSGTQALAINRAKVSSKSSRPKDK